MTTLFAFLHHLAAFTLVASVAVEFVLLRTAFSMSVVRGLRLADAVFGASAALIFVVGACRVFYFEKGPDYYLSSSYFLLKLALFVAVGIMSIIPTRALLSRAGVQGLIASASLRAAAREGADDPWPRARGPSYHPAVCRGGGTGRDRLTRP